MVETDEDPRLLMPVKPDAYNCSRVLDPDFHVQLRELFGPELIVGVPNRDFFVAATLKDPDLISRIRKRVHQDFANMHHPLTKRLLVVSADGVSKMLLVPWRTISALRVAFIGGGSGGHLLPCHLDRSRTPGS